MHLGKNGLTSFGLGIEDYIAMFDLSESDLVKSFLDCRGGASSFVAAMHQSGRKAIGCDPIYSKTSGEISSLVKKSQKEKIAHMQSHPECYVTSDLTDKFEDMLARENSEVDNFLTDLKSGLNENRYTLDSLPVLSFANHQFDIALVSHFLFTYSTELSVDFHVEAIKELARVASEVRVFPLVNRLGGLSHHVGHVVSRLQDVGFEVELRGVTYEFQKEGNAMMRVWSPTCRLD